jgi:hypothetical protein
MNIILRWLFSKCSYCGKGFPLFSKRKEGLFDPIVFGKSYRPGKWAMSEYDIYHKRCGDKHNLYLPEIRFDQL